MPILELHLLEGRSPEQKQDIAAALSETLVKAAECRIEQCIVLIHDVKTENYANAGVTAATRVKRGLPATTN